MVKYCTLSAKRGPQSLKVLSAETLPCAGDPGVIGWVSQKRTSEVLNANSFLAWRCASSVWRD